MRASRIDTPNYLLDALQPNIKPLGQYRRGELGCEILKGLALGGIITTMFVLPNSAQILTLFSHEPTPADRRRMRRTLSALRTNGLIDYSGRRGSQNGAYKLTRKGKRRVERLALESLRFPRQAAWDGKWHVILFDIPNTKKQARDALADRLVRVGCVQMQKSVYVYPYHCFRELTIVARVYGVEKDIDYLIAHHATHEKRLLKRFKLTRKRA